MKGGGEKLILELAKHLSKKGHEIDICTHLYKPDSTFEELSQFNVINLSPKSRSSNKKILRGFSLFLDTISTKLPLKKYDLFLVSTGGIGETIVLRNHSIPTAYICYTPLRFIHDQKVREITLKESYSRLDKRIAFGIATFAYSFLEKISWKKFDCPISISSNVKERIISGNLASPDRIKIAYPGINPDEFKPTWEYGKYFLVPGRINKWKRQDLAIEAFKIFCQKNGSFKIVITGHVADKDKEYFDNLRKDENEKILFYPSPNDEKYKDLFDNCYSILFTAVNEDFGIIPLEAMASGKPVISVNEGGPKETIIDGETGFLVEADPSKFAEKMLCLANDTNLLREMGRKARDHSLEFTWERFGEEVEGHLAETLEKRKN